MFEKEWTAGNNNKISFDELIKILKSYNLKGSKIFIGTDSFITNRKVIFASAICLHGKSVPGRYFFIREKEDSKKYINLVSRITEETHRSIKIAEFLMNEHDFNPQDIELHLDVSPFNIKNGTSPFSDMLKGYVQGYGLQCKIKPDAWASQSIADRHSK